MTRPRSMCGMCLMCGTVIRCVMGACRKRGRTVRICEKLLKAVNDV